MNEDDDLSANDPRMRPWAASAGLDVPDAIARDPDVLSWWTDRHDELIAADLRRDQWTWILDPRAVAAITPSDVLDSWIGRHEARSHISWYGYLAWFARGRAADLGLTSLVGEPVIRECERCEYPFLESSIRKSLTDRVGVDALIYCEPCLGSFLYMGTGDEAATSEDVLTYARAIVEVLGHTPRQDFGERLGDLNGFSKEHKLAILRVLSTRPSVRRVKFYFGSWKAAVAASAVGDSTAS